MLQLAHNADEVAAQFKAKAERLRTALCQGMQRAILELARYIGSQKLSGQVLQGRSGNCRAAVLGSAAVAEDNDTIRGSVSNDPASWYLRVQHEGAHIPEVSGKLMVFPPPGASKGQRDTIFTMKHRAFDLPAKPFMRDALQEQRERIVGELTAAMERALK